MFLYELCYYYLFHLYVYINAPTTGIAQLTGVIMLNNSFQAYDELAKRLENQCNIYKRLGESGDIGKHLYHKVQTGPGNPAKSVPQEAVSEYLRGGIISSFAEYEAFLHKILCEMVDVIHLLRHHPGNVIVPIVLQNRSPANTTEWAKSKIHKKLTGPKWSIFKKTFEEIFCPQVHGGNGIPNLELLSSDGEEKFSFCYPLTGDKYSKINGLNETDVANILDLWYGMRCVAAHGGVLRTTQHMSEEFKEFLPGNPINPFLVYGYTFSKFLKDNLKHPVKDNMSSVSRNEFRLIPSVPENHFIKSNLKEVSKVNVEAINNYFCHLQLDDLAASTNELSKGYGLYHIGRLVHFTCELEKDMYITYRMFVRVNQFLLLLSFRIQIALRKWLHNYGELNAIDGYMDHNLMTNLRDIINERDNEQEDKIKELMESYPDSCFHKFYRCLLSKYF